MNDKAPDVVSKSFGGATGRRGPPASLDFAGELFLPFAYNGEGLRFFLAKSRLIIQGGDFAANYLMASIGGIVFRTGDSVRHILFSYVH